MIYYKTEYPDDMTGQLLDTYLSKGWYRICQTIITTDVIFMDGIFYPVFWLRLNLRKYRHSRGARRILKRNRVFETAIRPFAVTAEIEELYTIYRDSIDFAVPETVEASLFGTIPLNVYDTSLIEIRDRGRLIAAGYYDRGKESTTGILHFFNPDYGRTSPGKYLMLIEIEESAREGKKFYYPGYISPETPKYDYKLFPSKEAAEIYLRDHDRWYPFLSVYEDIRHYSSAASHILNIELKEQERNN